MTESLAFRGYLSGHSGWVTAIATNPSNPDILVTSSRDKTIIVWQLTREESSFGQPKRILRGHNHFVSDVEISMDGQYALSSSWDKTLRLWDLNSGETTQRFVGHSKDVLSVSFSATNRQIVSGGMDNTVKIWNTIGDVKLELKEGGHDSWVSKVRFSPGTDNPVIVTAGHDKVVKVWDLATGKLKIDHFRHTGPINAITISPDGSLCASGGKDGVSLLWDLNDSKYLYRIDAGDEINALVFSPNRYWLCAATSRAVKIFDLESKNTVATLKPDIVRGRKGREPQAISLAWSSDGFNLFVGYTDNEVRIYTVI